MRKNVLLLSLLCFLLCLLPAKVVADEEELSALKQYASNIVQFNKVNPQEKVYLHMDNRSYFIGDTIFFKAYVLHSATHRLSNMSKVLYVELLSDTGIELERMKLKIDGGMCAGSFIVRDDYRTGYYEIRAYTRNMLNFGREPMPWMNIHKAIEEKYLHPYAITDEQRLNQSMSTAPLLANVFPTPIWEQSIVEDANHVLFSRVFPIYMRPEKAGEYKPEMDWYPKHPALAMPEETDEELRSDSLRISFYPEGGALVSGVTSRIAVDVHDQWGREKEIRGYIAEGLMGKDTVATFTSKERGRGLFELCPKHGERYVAHVTYHGKHYRYRLPEVEDDGYVLSVTPPIKGGEATFAVRTSRETSAMLGWTLMCRGVLTAFDTLRVSCDAERMVHLTPNQLIPGVNQLTLFGVRGDVLAERLFFVCPSAPACLHLNTQLPDTLRPFEEVTLDFQCNASNGYFSPANFSIAVTDAAERHATFDTGDLRSEMLLSSDLKGFIKDVDSYFAHANDTLMAYDIDMLMLVQGWRRYEWQTMAGLAEYVPRYMPEHGLGIEGRVVSSLISADNFADASKYKPYGNLLMRVEMRDPLITLSDTFRVDSLGRFNVDFGKDFFGEVPMTLTLLEPDGAVKKEGFFSRLKFAYPTIDRAFSPTTVPYNYYQNHTPEDDWVLTATQNFDWQGDVQIDNVDVKRRRKRTSEIYYDLPDIVVDYYKEWNKLIDRGIPNANHYDINNYYLGDESSQLTPEERNEIRLHYTLGRSRLWGRVARLPDSVFVYDKRAGDGRRNRYRVYLMPRTIKVYSNLVSRQPLGTAIDGSTETRPYAVWKPEYYKRSHSPKTAPYFLQNGVRHTYCEGYSRVVSYYHRDYSSEELPDSADYRRTLYWNPSVTTSMTGKVQLTFYNNSQTTKLHIRAEGITRYGEFIVYDSDKENE